jgi:hypothetical protein
MSTLITLLIFIIVLGLIYWAITLLPLPQPFKQIALVVLIVFAIIYLLMTLTGTGALNFPK